MVMTGPAAVGGSGGGSWRDAAISGRGASASQGPGLGRLPSPYLCPPSGSGLGRGDTRVGGPDRRGHWRAGLCPGPTSDLLPPQSLRVSTALGSDPRPPALSPRTCVPRRPAVPFPPRCTSGMNSGRDFLTLHGECPAGAPGAQSLRGQPRRRLSRLWRKTPVPSSSLRPAPGPPLGPSVALGKSRPRTAGGTLPGSTPAFPVKFPRSKRGWGGVPV